MRKQYRKLKLNAPKIGTHGLPKIHKDWQGISVDFYLTQPVHFTLALQRVCFNNSTHSHQIITLS